MLLRSRLFLSNLNNYASPSQRAAFIKKANIIAPTQIFILKHHPQIVQLLPKTAITIIPQTQSIIKYQYLLVKKQLL